MDMTTLTTIGGVVTSVASSCAAALAWKTKLGFSQEFRDARDEQIKLAKLQADAMIARKEAEIDSVKLEVQKKEIEIEKLRATIETMEKNSSESIIGNYQRLKAAYEEILEDTARLSVSNPHISKFNLELQAKQSNFENHLEALGQQIDWMTHISLSHQHTRKIAREWLLNNVEYLSKLAINHVRSKHLNLLQSPPKSELKYHWKRFCWDMDEYLETICDCLVVDRFNLIDRQLPTSPYAEAYIVAFEFIKTQLPSNLPEGVSDEISRHLDYLILTFQKRVKERLESY